MNIVLAGIDPVLFFALLAVLFASINLILWLTAWRRMDPGSNDDSLSELRERLSEVVERNTRLEDQLWGVLDSLKEAGQAVNPETLNSFSDAGSAIKELLENTGFLKDLTESEFARINQIQEDLEKIRNEIAILKECIKSM